MCFKVKRAIPHGNAYIRFFDEIDIVIVESIVDKLPIGIVNVVNNENNIALSLSHDRCSRLYYSPMVGHENSPTLSVIADSIQTRYINKFYSGDQG